jgi:hypothetical protein
MSSIATPRRPARTLLNPPVDEQEELSDIPLTPREGWLSVIALTVMMGTVGVALDDSRWAGNIGLTDASQTGFLPLVGILSVLVGFMLAKGQLGRIAGHLVGAFVGSVFLINAVSASVSTAPSIEQRLRALHSSVASWFEDVVVLGTRSFETSVFLLVLGALVWAAGQFGAYSVFRRHRPLPAVALTGFILLLNVGITIRDEYVHLVVFVAASLVLLIRLNLLDQAREWRARGMRDVADISQAFMRNGAAFVAIAIIAAVTLAANASSAPLARAWNNMDDEILEIGSTLNRLLGGISGSARGPNVLFTRTQTIRGVWESSSQVVFTATTSDSQGHRWRGATYDSFDGAEWQQLDLQGITVDAGADLLASTAESVSGSSRRREVTVTVTPYAYGDDIIVAPASARDVGEQAEVLVNGAGGPFVGARLVNGVSPTVPYTATSLVFNTRGDDRLTGNQLAAAGTDYPSWIGRFLERRPGSIGDIVVETANQIVASLPADQRDPYHLAVAVQEFLYRTGGFEYNTDIRNMCPDDSQKVDCLLEIKQGYCEYFASAMVMLLRQMGVPARYVLGYLPGKEANDVWTVDRSAAHAWAEVYFPNYGWVEFDPTPGNSENGQEPTILADGPPEGSSPSPSPRPSGQPECDGLSGELEEECLGNLPPVPPTVTQQPPPAPDTGGGWGPVLVVGAVLLALFGLALWSAAKRIPPTQPEVAYRGIARLAARLGYGPRPAQTVYEFASGLGQLVPVAQDDLKLIATAKVEATYGRREPADSMLRSLGIAYRRVRLGLFRLIMRRPRLPLRPRARRPRS